MYSHEMHPVSNHNSFWTNVVTAPVVYSSFTGQMSMVATFETCVIAAQVVVQLAVDKSRSVCLSVAHGEVDVAIIGGHVPEDLKDVLQACHPPAQAPLAATASACACCCGFRRAIYLVPVTSFRNSVACVT